MVFKDCVPSVHLNVNGSFNFYLGTWKTKNEGIINNADNELADPRFEVTQKILELDE